MMDKRLERLISEFAKDLIKSDRSQESINCEFIPAEFINDYEIYINSPNKVSKKRFLYEMRIKHKRGRSTIFRWLMLLLKGTSSYHKRKKYYIKKTSEYLKKHKYYDTFRNLKDRCNNPKNIRYKYYGGRGIKCLISRDELKYLWSRDNAFQLKKPSIDRIDPLGNYELKNCRFIEMSENLKRRVFNRKLNNT